MRKYEPLPFTATDLAAELMNAYNENRDASPWAPVYAEFLDGCWPGTMSLAEWENRLRATARRHHMYQTTELKGVRNQDWANWYAQDFVNRYNEGKPLYDFIHVEGVRSKGRESIIGAVSSAMKENSLSDFAQERFLEEADEANGIDGLVQVAERYVDFHASN